MNVSLQKIERRPQGDGGVKVDFVWDVVIGPLAAETTTTTTIDLSTPSPKQVMTSRGQKHKAELEEMAQLIQDTFGGASDPKAKATRFHELLGLFLEKAND